MDEIDEKMRELRTDLFGALEKQEQRIAVAITEKTIALKDLLEATTTARHSTIAYELGRVQKDNSACLGRCTIAMASVDAQLKTLTDFKISIQDFLSKAPDALKATQEELTEFRRWRDMNWQRTIVYTVVAVVAAIQFATWSIKLFATHPTEIIQSTGAVRRVRPAIRHQPVPTEEEVELPANMTTGMGHERQ